MRRPLFLLLLFLLAVPAAATASAFAPGDGTLSVKNGDGAVRLDVRGVVIGRLGSGTLTIFDPREENCGVPLVWGAEKEIERNVPNGLGGLEQRCLYRGKNIRFRPVGGQHSLRVNGKDIDLSVVGTGTIVLNGLGGTSDGLYSLNGGDYESLPDTSFRLTLAAPSNAG